MIFSLLSTILIAVGLSQLAIKEGLSINKTSRRISAQIFLSLSFQEAGQPKIRPFVTPIFHLCFMNQILSTGIRAAMTAIHHY